MFRLNGDIVMDIPLGYHKLYSRLNGDIDMDIPLGYHKLYSRLNGDIDMDIPLGYHKLANYCATLAHKVQLLFLNSSFLQRIERGFKYSNLQVDTLYYALDFIEVKMPKSA